MASLGRFARLWGASALVFLAIVLAGWFQTQYSQPTDPDDRKLRWLLLAMGLAGVAAATPIVDGVIRQRRRRASENRIKDALADQIVGINDALDPLVESLAKLILSPIEDRSAALQRLLTQALNSASQVIGPDRTRVSFFQADAAAEPFRLRCIEHAGRHGLPKTVFSADRADGEWVIDLLRKDEHHFCPSVKETPPPGWDGHRRRSYETFISVPAAVSGEAVGMITADAPNKGDLLESDVPLLRVLGTIIACGITIAEQEA